MTNAIPAAAIGSLIGWQVSKKHKLAGAIIGGIAAIATIIYIETQIEEKNISQEITIVPEYEILKDEILDSSKCKTIYEIPTPEVIEEQKEEIIEEEPEVIEEIEDEIVKTNMGEEFGIDEEMIVYFINSNVFFTNIMKDFPKVNLVMEDDDRNLELKATIGSDGKITLLEDGLHGDADVTIYVPLRDALNIFSNANNINPLTLLSFAVNVRTEPVEIKDQVIRDVIAGKYN